MSQENDANNLQKFRDFLIVLGMPRREATEKLQGISWEQLKGNSEIRKTIEKLWASCENDKKRHEEKRRLEKLKQEQEQKLKEVEAQLKLAQSEAQAAEAERKKLLERKDEILKSLDTNQ